MELKGYEASFGYNEKANQFIIRVQIDDIREITDNLMCYYCEEKIDYNKEIPYFCFRKKWFMHKSCLINPKNKHYFLDENEHKDTPVIITKSNKTYTRNEEKGKPKRAEAAKDHSSQ